MSNAFENEAFDLEGDEKTKVNEAHENPRLNSASENNTDTIVNVNVENKKEPEDIKEDESGNIIARIRNKVHVLGVKNAKFLNSFFIITIFLLYNAFLIGAIYHATNKGLGVSWCDGLGFLLILTFIVYWSLFYYFILKKYAGKRIQRIFMKLTSKLKPIWAIRYVRIGCALLVLGGLITFLVLDAKGQERKLVSILGVVVVLLVCFLFSKHPGKIVWQHVMWGLGMQFIFGLTILRWEGGRSALDCISTKVKTFLDFANSGSIFIYSYLSSGSATATIQFNPNNSSMEPTDALITMPTIFVFQALSVIYFFGFVVSLLYHLGAMTWLVSKLGWFLQITIGTTAAESMNAAANIFLGQTEAPLLVKPYLPEMTISELHSVMTGGFATIAGSVMAAYITFGIDAGYLLSASVMAAPAALGLSKLVYPETEKSKTTSDQIKKIKTKEEGNALDAAAQGAIQGVILIGCIVANLIAFISFIAFLNAIMSWCGGLVGADYISFEWILGKIFIPVAWLIGIKWEETEDVALLLGLKIVVNEFVAYERLVTRMTHLSERSKGIATYALCSFANFSSIGIQLGGLGALAPSRRADLSSAIWRALLAGTATGLLNGCVASLLLTASD